MFVTPDMLLGVFSCSLRLKLAQNPEASTPEPAPEAPCTRMPAASTSESTLETSWTGAGWAARRVDKIKGPGGAEGESCERKGTGGNEGSLHLGWKKTY